MLNRNALFLNTILLGGTTAQKLEAVADAGFAQAELWQQDVQETGGDTEGIRHHLSSLGISLTDYQVLLDFDGAADVHREIKRQQALEILDTAVKVGADTVLVPANTERGCLPDKIVSDLQWLTEQAVGRNLRIAYEAMCWSTCVNTTPEALKIINEVDSPALGLVIDAFHIFALQRTVADLAEIPAEKIFLVQLSDVSDIPDKQQLIDIARHQRLLPGDGVFPLQQLLACLREKQYQGPLGLEVFNDELKKQPPADVARQAMAALRRLIV
ncbi:hypothetical protein GCM10009414_24400 [Tatumella terrea]|uniref:sugar phosphate isomerase/epimerase family protein n=1 Tax=Tatumella terrea TaxID=419007 RepID=UPI0031D8FEE8